MHIGVGVLPAFLAEPAKSYLVSGSVHAGHQRLHVLVGIKLVQATWHQSIPEFPAVWVGLSYLPIPVGGVLTSLFVIERAMTQNFFSEPEPDTVSQISTE